MISKRRRWKRKRWRYFYYGGFLHKTLKVNRARDECEAFRYNDGKKYYYLWSDVQHRGYPALTLKKVSEIVNRKPQTIYNLINTGRISKPEKTYSLENGNPGNYMFSRQDVQNLHDYIKNLHFGRPRNDGVVNNRNVPNPKEVAAAVNHGIFVYVKNDQGEYVPTWKADEW